MLGEEVLLWLSTHGQVKANSGASQVALLVKNLPANAGGIRDMGLIPGWVWSLGQEDPWREKWELTPLFLPGESHGQRSLVGYRPGHRVTNSWTHNPTLLLLHPHICTGWGTWWCWLLSCSPSRSRWLRPLQWYGISPVHTPWLLHTVFLNLF